MNELNDDVERPEDIIRILVATDVHLGYLENDPVRGQDSFIAFEEVLSHAVQYDVDLVLLGGDLFHHAKPSLQCMLRCSRLLRKYCFGDKPVAVEVISDQFKNFARTVNYEDPNLNVSYPILSIHGNHDDPIGQDAVSSLDILSSIGLVNYFGRWSDYTQVKVSPVLIQKGTTRLALYGLSHLKDQRLSRLFKDGSVEMEQPSDVNEWFNLLVLHQNRADRGEYNYISESVLPDFLDLVVWGHEHDCQIREIKNEVKNFYVTQPGSTVATSLSAGEALPKHCGLLQIYKKKFLLNPIPLKTVRPFIFRTIVLSEENLGLETINENDKVQEFLKSKVYQAIEDAEQLLSGDPNQPTLPLIRLSVFYEHHGQDFNRVRFGQNFSGVIANPQDVLLMKCEKKLHDRKKESAQIDGAALAQVMEVSSDLLDVEALLQAYFREVPKERRLTVLSSRAMAEAVHDFTIKNTDETFRKTFQAHKAHCINYLMKGTAETEAEVIEQLTSCKEALDTADEEAYKATMAEAAAAALKLQKERSREEPEPAPSPPTPPPPAERRTPRRSAANKSSAWLQDYMSATATATDVAPRTTRNSARNRDS